MVPDFQSLLREKGPAIVEKESQHEIPLRGGSFKFSTVDTKKGVIELKSATFVGRTQSRNLSDFFPGTIPVKIGSFLKDSYLHDDPENHQIESIHLSELKTERGLRTLLHEGGHFKQFHEPTSARIGDLRAEFFAAHKAYQPLEKLFAIAEQLAVSAPSLRAELETIKRQYEQMDKATLEPPIIDLEVLRQRDERKMINAKLEVLRKEAELIRRQIAKIGMEMLGYKLTPETLPYTKRVLPLLEKLVAGELDDFMDEGSMCGAEIGLDPARLVFSFLGEKGDIHKFELMIDGEARSPFQELASQAATKKVEIETLSIRLSEVLHFLSTNDKTTSNLMRTHRYFDVAGSGSEKTDRDVSLKTLTYFMDYATALLERDATERAVAWMEELRHELAIDLLGHEEEDWYLTLDCLGTYGANSSQLEEKLGVIPRIEGVAHLN